MSKELICKKCGHDIWNIATNSKWICMVCNYEYTRVTGEVFKCHDAEVNDYGDFVYTCKITIEPFENNTKEKIMTKQKEDIVLERVVEEAATDCLGRKFELKAHIIHRIED